jgi:hypothetical protein
VWPNPGGPGRRNPLRKESARARKICKLGHYSSGVLTSKYGSSNYAISPAPLYVHCSDADALTPPDHIAFKDKTVLSEISEHEHGTPWYEIWRPQALNSSKSVSLFPSFYNLRRLAPRIPFTGKGTVNPCNCPPPTTAAHGIQTLPLWRNPLPRCRSGFRWMKIYLSVIMEDNPIYHV